jgi:type II secretion system protein G
MAAIDPRKCRLVAVLMAIPALASCGASEPTREEIHLCGLLAALDLYRMDRREYPATEFGLKALVTPNAQRPEGYVRDLPVDRWARQYGYVREGAGWSAPIRVYSLGRNGRDERGSGDDYSGRCGETGS